MAIGGVVKITWAHKKLQMVKSEGKQRTSRISED